MSWRAGNAAISVHLRAKKYRLLRYWQAITEALKRATAVFFISQQAMYMHASWAEFGPPMGSPFTWFSIQEPTPNSPFRVSSYVIYP